MIIIIVDNEWVDSKIKTCAEEDADHHDQHQRCALSVPLTHLREKIKIMLDNFSSGVKLTLLIVDEFWIKRKI